MDFVFNEFCFRDAFADIHAGREGMGNLLSVCKQGRKLGISRLAVRYDFYQQFLAAGYTIADWLNDKAVSKLLKDLLFSIVRHPYIDNNDKTIEDRYILSNTVLIDDEITKAEGLAIAYLYNTISISLYSSEKWNVHELSLKFSEEEYDDQIVKVKHASLIQHIEVHTNWITSRVGVKLVMTALHPSQKRISLRDDHGYNVLYRFSKKLVRSPFITEVINSMPFNPYYHSFIKNRYEDGRIEIVLVRSDEGFGLVVRTTGNSIAETEAISKILSDEFQDAY